MLIPSFWAEARLQKKSDDAQVTVRRWGWSTESQKEAEEHAVTRAEEALRRILAGESLPKRERKLAYNGAEGAPIREEVLEQGSDWVITRNSYGAHCLNTGKVLFVDVDHVERGGCLAEVILIGLSLGVAALVRYWGLGLLGAAIAGLGTFVGLMLLSQWLDQRFGGHERRKASSLKQTRKRVSSFSRSHPEFGLRVYETPNGVRIMATHRTFDPLEPATAELFAWLDADPIYVQMCSRQACFRARLTPKPWRMKEQNTSRPPGGMWPVFGEALTRRKAWVQSYERDRRAYAACRFVFEVGVKKVDPDVAPILKLHDERAFALKQRPLA